ncbi:hypothetical protein HDU92_003908 [Lobulomyces angularis]|nr:hypothetical protein HDU92_003908 [Lobulomyces angularis]
MDLKLAKKVLRTSLNKKLSLIQQDKIDSDSIKVFNHLKSLECYASANSISTYLNMKGGKEIKTDLIVEDFIKNKNKKIFIPLCEKDVMHMLSLASMEDFKSLPLNNWNIPEPKNSSGRINAFESGLDLIIMPGLAFDRYGNRLGHGKGYYDKFLLEYKNFAVKNHLKMPQTVAISLSAQIIDEEIPHNDLDVKPDIILTPDGILQRKAL